MKRSLLIITGVAVAVVAVAIYFFYDPASSGFFPRCPFLMLTGQKCPGCGSQRALHALLHGDAAGAVRHNAALVVAVPLLLWLLVAECLRTRHPALYARMSPHWLPAAVLVLVLLWWLLRNLAGL